MSVTTTNLGTTDLTYSHNPDRSGQWATYLLDLSLKNGHDRARVNGELNVDTGLVDEKKQLPESRILTSRTIIAQPLNHQLIERYRKSGYNPSYLIT